MKNTRCFKWTALLTAVVMVLILGLSAVPAAGEGIWYGGDVYEQALLDERFVDSAVITDGGDKEVADLAAADPNNTFTLHLSVKEDKKANTNLDKLPENTDETVMVYQLPNMTAVNGENTVVSWNYTSGVLEFRWKGEKQKSFTADVAVAPAYPAVDDLSGTYALIAKTGIMVTDTVLKYDARGRVAGTATKDVNGLIRPESWQNTAWTLTHVTGEWYTVSTSGKYMRFTAGNNLTLTGPENAQKIRIQNSAVSGYYVFSADKLALDNSGGGVEKGISAWEYKGDPKNVNDNEKFRLVSLDKLDNAAKQDLSGTWAITHTNGKAILSSKAYDGKPKLSADLFAMNGDKILPYGDIVFWSFEHVARDWYYVSSNGQYLNIASTGLTLSGEKQALRVTTSDNFKTINISSDEFSTRSYSVMLVDGKASSGFGTSAYNAGNANQKLTLLSTTAFPGVTTNISGSYAIVTESSGAALSATVKADDSSKLTSIQTIAYPDNTVKGDGVTLWTLTQISGDWYTVQANGQYLSLEDKNASMTDTPTQLYIQENNGKYRITNGKNVALNNSGNNAKNGYYGVASTDASAVNEWHSLKRINDGTGTYLLFNVNGGNVTKAPTAVKAEAGENVTLPDYTGTKNGKRFIGWAKVSNIYVNPEGRNNCYQDVYPAGSSYTVPAGETTLYAVYNEKDLRAQFGFRKDGTIPDEPSNYPQKDYSEHVYIDNAVKDGKWVVDVNAEKEVEGNHVANNVAANLNVLPTDAQIKSIMPSYDPETQYVHWYVLKYSGNMWKVDGVLHDRAGKKTITYDTNVNHEFTAAIQNVPLGYQSDEGETITVAKDPVWDGYEFLGWSTDPEGNGDKYRAGDAITMDQNVTLYAQWDDVLTVEIESNVAGYEKVYAGTLIELTAVRGGTYTGPVTYQWKQVDPDTGEEEIIPGATEEKYTFTINAENAKYLYHVTLTPVEQE